VVVVSVILAIFVGGKGVAGFSAKSSFGHLCFEARKRDDWDARKLDYKSVV